MIDLLIASKLVVLLFAGMPAKHEFHVSKCLIEYRAEEKTLQISLHLFVDDVEEALRKQGADQLFLCTDKESAQAMIYVERYLQQRFQLKIDGKLRPFKVLGKEPSDDLIGMWCYLEITDLQPFQQLTIKNAVLTEVFSDQKNLVNIVHANKKKSSLLFHRDKPEQSLSF